MTTRPEQARLTRPLRPTRRALFLGGTAVAAAAVLRSPRHVLAAATAPGASGPRPELPVIAELRPDAQGDIRIGVAAGSMEFRPGVVTPTLGYNGNYLGPALRVRRGQTARVRVTNHLSDMTTLHWHGLEIPGADDGGPYNAIAPGKEWIAELAIDQPAATCWYHPHPYPTTAELVVKGLAGLFIIDDEESAALGLPSRWGVDDIAIVLQDRRFNADGTLFHRFNLAAITAGYVGNTLLVNGAEYPAATTARGWLRLRILNGSNARTYRLAASDGRSLYVVASDGGLLTEPVEVKELPVFAGERYEVLVDARDGQRFDLVTLPVSQLAMALPPFNQPLAVMTFAPDGADGQGALPDALATLPSLSAAPPAVSQTLLMGMNRDAEGMELFSDAGLGMGGARAGMASMDGSAGAGMGGMGRSVGGGMGHGAMAGAAAGGMAGASPAAMAAGIAAPGGPVDPKTVEAVTKAIVDGPVLPQDELDTANTVNGQSFQLGVVPITAAMNTTLRWSITEGTDNMVHPVHIHGCQFRIVSCNGAPPPAYRAGWKDIVPLEQGATCEIEVRFKHPATKDRPYMAHCHILEHEDSGMMTSFSTA